ncbi:hypothetical protein CEE37_08025 [candidate division LCP-89 bacterium B3_LCP]|uniref:SPOR domain-containing protein n=1 Tax=candidate division LCP-89 bacterium B3_LCP TaxID=2012998 RepID=A0A532UZ78_UNCL8|nr:MAG: hypothetical protein CEE37_08025 [candidate division LCP-89 bacterium B3_LCP]
MSILRILDNYFLPSSPHRDPFGTRAKPRSNLILFITIILLMISSTIRAQDAYNHGEAVEINLDDFPRLVDGYRIQLGAFSKADYARNFKDTLDLRLDEKVHIRFEDNIWRVRVGDFSDSVSAAEYRNTALAFSNFFDARIVSDKIASNLDNTQRSPKVQGFRIQVNALKGREQALELGRKLDFDHSDIRVYVIFQKGSYAVRIGDFMSRSDAVNWMNKTVSLISSKAWIVPSMVYSDPPPSPVERPVGDPFEFKD